MNTLDPNYHALVIGASGALGNAFVQALEADPHCRRVVGVSRQSHPGFNLEDASSLTALAHSLQAHAPFHLIIDATGALTLEGRGPEKHLGALEAEHLQHAFMVNATGPALLLKHLAPLLPAKGRCVYAKLSARVGSISDNHKGGWYGYRASKAALNMLLQTAAIELARKRPELVVAALQPGTVKSRLSEPFVAAQQATDPARAVTGLLQALDSLAPSGRAHFIDYKGETIPW